MDALTLLSPHSWTHQPSGPCFARPFFDFETTLLKVKVHCRNKFILYLAKRKPPKVRKHYRKVCVMMIVFCYVASKLFVTVNSGAEGVGEKS